MVHNKQFILDRVAHAVDSTWKSVLLKNGFVLSYQSNLNVIANPDNSIILLGHAWQINKDRRKPEVAMQVWNDKTSMEDISTEEQYWAGRYVLITLESVLLDATGNLGIFYSKNIVSSSLSLLATIKGSSLIPPPLSIYSHEGVDYIPGCKTPYTSICRCLPSQTYNYITNEVVSRKLLVDVVKLSDSILLEKFEELFLHSIDSFCNHFDGYDIWIPISGGRDSRVCLSAFALKKKNYRVYVFRNKDARFAGCYQDYAISKLLAKKLNKKLYVVHKAENKVRDDKRMKKFYTHTAGISTMSFKWLYEDDAMSSICGSSNLGVQVRNNIWELVCDAYANHMNSPESIAAEFSGREEMLADSIDKWIKLVRVDKINTNLSWGERAYWDLRLGCWLANGMQGADIFNVLDTINILNSRVLISLLMNLNANLRHSRIFEEDFASKWTPSFAQIPYEENYHDARMFFMAILAKISHKIKKIKKNLIVRNRNEKNHENICLQKKKNNYTN